MNQKAEKFDLLIADLNKGGKLSQQHLLMKK